jgi:hypothetical protein
METEGTIPGSQQLATGTHHEPAESIPHNSRSIFNIIFNISHISAPISHVVLSFRVSENFYEFLNSPMRAICPLISASLT